MPIRLLTARHGARDGSHLLTWIRGILHRVGVDADGEVWLQCFWRLPGFVFNPIGLWFGHDSWSVSGGLCWLSAADSLGSAASLLADAEAVGQAVPFPSKPQPPLAETAR